MSISSIPDKEARLLFTLSGNLCAFPGCNSPLTEMPTDADAGVNVSDICHIVADSRHGPRGRGVLGLLGLGHRDFVAAAAPHHGS